MDKPRNEKDRRFMQLAIEEARKSLREGVFPVGAIVVNKGEVIGAGRRKKENHPFMDHAEMLALREALGSSWNKEVVTLYTTLEPCVMCFATALNTRQVESIVYAVEDPYGGGTKLDKHSLTPRYQEHWPNVQGGVLQKEATDLLKQFFAQTNDSYWVNPNNPLRKSIESS